MSGKKKKKAQKKGKKSGAKDEVCCEKYRRKPKPCRSCPLFENLSESSRQLVLVRKPKKRKKALKKMLVSAISRRRRRESGRGTRRSPRPPDRPPG